MSSNTLLAYINAKDTDRLITVAEDGLSDANFVITHLIKDAFEKSHRVCLLALHNTLGHYHNVLKRLNCDLLKKIQEGQAKVLEPLKTLAEDFVKVSESGERAAPFSVQAFIESLHKQIELFSEERSNSNGILVVVDDLSHLLDVGASVRDVFGFANRSANLANGERVRVLLATHVSGGSDEIVANGLKHASDLVVGVSVLKTGFSSNVTGVIEVDRVREGVRDVYHYKASDKEIKVFSPGESLYYLYK